MAIQYYMRAFNTSLSQYVDWVVNDAPDSTGTFSGYPTNQLIDITVNRVVTSKVDNFLKQNQSLGGTDGYYFHVNSYDWRNAVAPISPPTNLVGLAIERGIVTVTPVTAATNASPIVVTASAPHGLATGQIVTITGGTGNIAVNGTWPVIVTSPTQFSLVGSVGNGTYTGGGNIFIPRDFSTLTWDENAAGFPNGVWRFVLNTNGDGTTLGASQDVKMNSAFLDGYLQLGPDPADSGAIRLSNNTYINSESNPSGTDLQLLGADLLNRIKIGSVNTDITYMPGALVVDGYIAHDGSGNNVATTGFIRTQNAETIAAFRAQSLLSDIIALSSDSANRVIIGDAANGGTLHNTSTGNVHQFQVNTAPQFEIGTAFARFTQSIVTPVINQIAAGVGISGQTLTIQAQNAGTGSTTGGILSLTSGTGSSFHGTVDISTGGILKMRVFPTTANTATDNNSILFLENKLRFDAAQSTPTILQDVTSGASGQTLTVQAQNSTQAGSTGGALNLTSGTGVAAHGRVNIQTGGTTQIIVSPTTIAPGGQVATTGSVIILGNLEVVGTTTTIDSTVVDIIGRVVHANWSDPVVSPNVSVPSQIVGYSVHRGNSSGFARDGAAWIWTEGAQNNGSDGYWRANTIPGDGYGTDNFTAANSTNNFGVQAKTFAPTPDPNPVAGTLPATGGIRSPNNLPVTVARNVSPTTTITGGPGATLSNLAALPQATINVASTTGFSTSGTILVFSSAGPQTITYTGTSGTTFTGCVGGTGTLLAGNYVAQTNNSTTIAAGSNNTALPQATINVASTVGFPPSGTLRIVTSVSGVTGQTLSVQTVTYTGGGGAGTQFTGCTGGTGTMFTGNAVSSLPITGSADLTLVGTDFGNRVLWGSPSNLTGHIFNTPTNTLFDFQVNSVPQIRIQANDTNSDGYVEVLEIEPTVVSPRIAQLVRPDFGANAGFQLTLQAQNGQNQSGANPNNNGGNLVLASGAAGTGGNAPAVHGNVVVQTDGELKMTIFPTFAAAAANSNTMLIEENIIRIGPTQNVPLIRQDSTTNANGQSFTLQAQNAATRGGPLLLTSGTGPGSLDGYINLTTGTTVKATFFPTFAISAADNNSILLFENKLRFDIAQTVPLIRQDDQTAASTNGQSMTLQAQNATGATSNGGPLLLKSGTGTGSDGYVDIITGGTLKARFNPTFAVSAADSNTLQLFENIVRFDSTMNVPLIRQDTTGSASGQSLTLQAQNAATTGGPLLLTAGTGATNDGYINLITGTTVKMTIFPTTAVSAANNNSILFFENKLRFDTAQVTPLIRQDDKTANGGTGETLTIQAQNETGTTSTGGNLNLSSGTGTSANGTINLQVGGTTAITFNNVDSDASGYSEAITLASTIVAPRIFQASTVGATGTILALMAQSAATTGGPLQLHSGTGATNDGYINLTTGNTVKVTIHPTTATVAANNNSIQIFENKVRFDTAQTTPLIRQDDKTANGGTGESLTLQAQNETGTTSTGGALILTSGTGTTTAGNTQIQTGGVDKIIVHPAFTEFRDTAEALRITPVSAGTTQITFASTVTAAQINQTTTGSATGANMTVQAQNAATTGGNVVVTSGTGTTAGNVQLQTGAVDRVVVHPTFTEFRDTAEALRIAPGSSGITTVQFASTVTAVSIRQADLTTNSGTGAPTTIQAQNETGTTSTGGDLNLTSGTGTSSDGNLNLQAGGSTVARVHTNKISFLKGWRRHVTAVTGTYQVLVTDDYLAITTLAAPFTITMPASPTLGDTYEIKDATGNAASNNVTIAGNGTNIDGAASFVLNSAYAAVTLTFTGTDWSIS